MSSAEQTPALPVSADRPANDVTSWPFWEGLLERAGERLNPILVKETRQALKSRQFTVTFWLLLVFGAAWSFVGVSLLMPAVYYLPSGRFMLIGYYFILGIPLLLVVPFSAYRSLAIEREDGTYELLSITSLSARQIVTGKLGSALLQMLVYYAALAPCIAFTYLLRGMDIGAIVILLVGTFLASVMLSTVGLVFAGMNRARQWQALSSVLLLLLLILAGWAWSMTMIAMVMSDNTGLDDPIFWLGIAFFLTMYASFLALLILTAAAQNSFASDNRSTKIRMTMLAQMTLYTGWMMFLWFYVGEKAIPFICLSFGGACWAFYGAVLTGEFAELSPRAMRDLPQSFLGRTFLTWFNPGSATGYVFTLTSFLTFVLLILTVNTIAAAEAPSMAADLDELVPFGLLMWAYMSVYLGLGRLIVIGLRKLSDFGLAAVVLIHILLLTAGAAIPTFIQYWLQDFRDADYSTLQAMNCLWTLIEVVDGSWSMGGIVFTVVSLAMIMCVLQLVLAAKEVEAVRLETPARVKLKDDSPATSP